MTFAELAQYFAEHYLIPARYIEGRKVAGRRNVEWGIQMTNVLVKHFGNARIREITHGDIERYKSKRLNTATKDGTQRAIASINRELSMLRRILNVAQKEGWIRLNPFGRGDTLISVADEVKRTRILSRDEETRLLAACTDRREHLRPIIICALDTGMRRGEIFTLRWQDVDLDERQIRIQAFNTKTMTRRTVSITSRLASELTDLRERHDYKPSDLVFGIGATIKRSFATACKIANITGLHFHDLRHSAATRLAQGGLPITDLARILGHANIQTTYRYVNATPETGARAVDILEQFQTEKERMAIN
jgi:integrase